MKKIIIGAALVLCSLTACGTSTDEPQDISGTITEKEFEAASSSCTMLFKAPGKPAPAPAKPPAVKPPVAPVKPAATGAAKPAGGSTYKPAQGDVKPHKTYKAGSYKVYPYTGLNRCYKADCWEFEIQASDGQYYEVCVSREDYARYEVGNQFPKEG